MATDYQQIDATFAFTVGCSGATAGATTGGRRAEVGDPAGSTEVAVNPGNNVTRACMSWALDPLVHPRIASWPAGTWVIRINHTTMDAGTTLVGVYVCDDDSGSFVTVASNTSPGHTAGGTGVLTVNVVQGSSHTPQDQINSFPRVILVYQNTDAHGGSNLGITPNQIITAPYDLAAPDPVSASVAVGSEALAVVDITQPTAVESIESIAREATAFAEAARSLAAERTSSTEAAAAVVASAVALAEAVAAVLADIAVPLEAEGTATAVSRALAVALEALSRAAFTRSAEAEGLASTSAEAGPAAEAKADAAGTTDTAAEALGRAVVERAAEAEGLASSSSAADAAAEAAAGRGASANPFAEALAEARQGIDVSAGSVAPVAFAREVAVAATAGVLAALALEEEALGRVANGDPVPVESLGVAGSVARQVEAAIEALSAVAGEGAVSAETVRRILRQQAAEAEALRGVSAAHDAEAEALRAVNAEAEAAFEALGETEVARQVAVPFEALADRVSVAEAAAEALASLSAEDVASSEALELVRRAADAALDAVGQAARAIAVSFEADGTILSIALPDRLVIRALAAGRRILDAAARARTITADQPNRSLSED